MEARRHPPVVCMIVGWGRSGSTLLDRLLGQVPGIVSAGELREFWLRGPIENRACGCGERYDSCPHWRQVGQRLERQLDLDVAEIWALRRQWDRGWTIPALLATNRAGREPAALRRYRRALAALYEAIFEVTAASVVVDSSKLVSHALIAGGLSEIDCRLVHLVRDPRGVAYSWSRTKPREDDPKRTEEMQRYGNLPAALRYVYYNGWVPAIQNHGRPGPLRVRYEDLLAGPRPAMRRILDHLDVPPDTPLDFLGDEAAMLSTDHLIDGNPMRFLRGSLTLRHDDTWRTRMPSAGRALVTTVTYPLMRAYGYRV